MIVYLPEPPSANRWWRKFRNRMVLSPEARAYKTAAATMAIAQFSARGMHATCIVDGPVRVEIEWRRKRKAGDLDKRLGVVLDALQGILYANDSQITQLYARRLDATPDSPAGLSVEVLRA